MFGLPTPDEHDVLFGASYELPVLWGSLFTRDDILHLQADVDEPVVYPALCAPTAEALKRGFARLEAIESAFPSHRDNFQAWRQRLARARKRFLVVETVELWHMGDEFGDELEALLDAWADPAGHAQLNLIRDAGRKPHPSEALIGYDWMD
jgi:hypothetical protein